LAGDAEPGADLGPRVATGAQAPNSLGYGGVNLTGEPGHKDECIHVALPDTTRVGAQDAADECGVLVILDLPPWMFGVNASLTVSGLRGGAAG
jgi:hypothetical protein